MIALVVASIIIVGIFVWLTIYWVLCQAEDHATRKLDEADDCITLRDKTILRLADEKERLDNMVLARDESADRRVLTIGKLERDLESSLKWEKKWKYRAERKDKCLEAISKLIDVEVDALDDEQQCDRWQPLAVGPTSARHIRCSLYRGHTGSHRWLATAEGHSGDHDKDRNEEDSVCISYQRSGDLRSALRDYGKGRCPHQVGLNQCNKDAGHTNAHAFNIESALS